MQVLTSRNEFKYHRQIDFARLSVCVCTLVTVTYTVPPCCGASSTGSYTKMRCILIHRTIFSEHWSWLDPSVLGGDISWSSLEFYGVMERHLRWLWGFPWGEVSKGMLLDYWYAGQDCPAFKLCIPCVKKYPKHKYVLVSNSPCLFWGRGRC